MKPKTPAPDRLRLHILAPGQPSVQLTKDVLRNSALSPLKTNLLSTFMLLAWYPSLLQPLLGVYRAFSWQSRQYLLIFLSSTANIGTARRTG